MYDIQNALRRRAMAERLEALSRAVEATTRAAESSEVPARPRHLAEPSRPNRARGNSTRVPADAQPSLDADPAPAAATLPAQPSVVLADQVPPAQVPAPAMSGSDSPSGRGRGETMLAVRAPDQTARLEVPAVRVDPANPPPLRSEGEAPVPLGVTLLRDALDLPAREPVALPVNEPREAEDRAVSDSAPAPVDDVPDDPPYGGSSAATIADLLRHGSTGLFFGRRT